MGSWGGKLEWGVGVGSWFENGVCIFFYLFFGGGGGEELNGVTISEGILWGAIKNSS